MVLKVISLNLWSTPAPVEVIDKAEKFLSEQQPDLLLLQEVNTPVNQSQLPNISKKFKTLQSLRELFPSFYWNFAPAVCDTRKHEGEVDSGQLILSKFPLNKAANIFFDIPYGKYNHDATTDFSHFPASVQVVNATINELNVKLLNVHGPVNMNGLEDDTRRLHMRDTLLEQTKDADRLILCGDFNVRPQTQTIQSLEKELKNVFKDELITTFNIKRKNLDKSPGYADAVVDMMFISDNFTVVSHECPQVDISDHLPLVAQLEI